jgi:hypothetical protein
LTTSFEENDGSLSSSGSVGGVSVTEFSRRFSAEALKSSATAAAGSVVAIPTSVCAPGYTDVGCGVCDDGYYKQAQVRLSFLSLLLTFFRCLLLFSVTSRHY